MQSGITSHNSEYDNIKSIEWLNCGYCRHNGKIISNINNTNNFGAGVLLIKHKHIGYILYDTGYSNQLYKCGFKAKIYNLITPTTIDADSVITKKIKSRGIKDISKVIISHGHPDHIGALKVLNCDSIITTENVALTMQKPLLKDLVFKGLIPDELKYNILKSEVTNHWLNKYFSKVYDIFDDGSILGIEMNGHSKGMLGLYIPKVNSIFAADASWGWTFLNNYSKLTQACRFIQNDWNEYKNTSEMLLKLSKDNKSVKIYFSHDIKEDHIIC